MLAGIQIFGLHQIKRAVTSQVQTTSRHPFFSHQYNLAANKMKSRGQIIAAFL
jgi:hypothetical protein